MSRRNLIFVLLVGLALMLGAAGAAQRDAERTDSTTTRTATPAPQTGPGGAEANLVEGDLPAERPIRAEVGDDVELRVASTTPDVAELPALGVRTAVGPGLPGTLRFRALSAGRFPVTYEVAGTTAGELVVSEPGADQDADAAP